MVIHFAVYIPISTEAVQAQKLRRGKKKNQQISYSVFNPYYEFSFPFEQIYYKHWDVFHLLSTKMYLIL